MISVLMIFGFILIFAAPIYCAFFDQRIQTMIRNAETQKIVLYLAMIPGAILLGVAFYMNAQKPSVSTEACGIVERYYSYGKRCSRSERVVIRVEPSMKQRHLNFKSHVPRWQQGQRVCFEYYDRYQNPHLGQSTILRALH